MLWFIPDFRFGCPGWTFPYISRLTVRSHSTARDAELLKIRGKPFVAPQGSLPEADGSDEHPPTSPDPSTTKREQPFEFLVGKRRIPASGANVGQRLCSAFSRMA